VGPATPTAPVSAGISYGVRPSPSSSGPLAPGSTGSFAVSPSGGESNAGAAMAAKALAATRAAGLKPDVAYVPRPSASPAQVAEAVERGAAAPLYTGGPAPMGLADYGLSLTGDTYVSNWLSDTVTAISGTTNAPVATLPVGADPVYLTFDPGNHELYVVNAGSNTVSVINVTTNTVDATLHVGLGPYGAAYDSENGNLYVADYFANTVTVISGLSNTAVATIPVGTNPEGMAFDPVNGELYVADHGSANVTTINGTTNSVVGSIPLTNSTPVDVAFNSAKDTLYVTGTLGTVSVINGVTNTLSGVLFAGNGAYGVAYDSGNGKAYVACYSAGTVAVFDGATNDLSARIPLSEGLMGVGYDAGNGEVYVTNYLEGSVTAISGSTVVATVPVGNGASDAAYAGTTITGTLNPSVLNTTGLIGIVAINGTGIHGQDLYQSSPDGFSIQMNAVLTNITLFGAPGFSFWTQDVVTYFPSTGYMFLVTNVWNFSAPNDTVTSNALYQHGPDGTNAYGSLGYYYSSYAVPTPEIYPFDVFLGMSSSVSGGRNEVSFSVTVSSSVYASDNFNMTSLDYVVFNSTSLAHPSVSLPSNFTASGVGFNKVGLSDDFELVITGPGGGSQVDLSSAQAELDMEYLAQVKNSSEYFTIPSAYDYGSDTGETSTGANVNWWLSNTSPAPVPWASMTTGPSLLTGLWGTGAPSGSSEFFLGIYPTNAFTFFLYCGTAAFTSPIVAQYEFAPTETTLFHLMPGTYIIFSELADHTRVVNNFSVPGTLSLNVTLDLDPGLGAYTPLWAFSNSELSFLAQSGTGTPTLPYVLYNNQYSPLSSDFGLYNDYGFPVFPGVFLKDTSASVILNNTSSFETYTNNFQPSPAQWLPPTNDLQYWFWNVTNVALHNATNISGWFSRTAYFPLTFNSFNVVFYASEGNLIANNVFLSESQGLLLYMSGTQFGPQSPRGGNNTIWGNRFLQIDPPLGCPGPANCSTLVPYNLLPYNSGLGLEVGEWSDLIYNNLFDTPTTAWSLPLNLYSGYPEVYPDTWNISTQPAGNVHTVPEFPTIPLSGSIVNGSTQGGNSWWDYGVSLNWANGADNPTGVLPYDENASNLLSPEPGYGNPIPGYGCTKYYCTSYIHPGGDYAPLVPAGAAVAIGPHGLLSGTLWGAVVSCAPIKGNPGGGPPGNVCCAPIKGNPGGGPPGCAGDPPAVVFAQFTTTAPSVNLVLPDGGFNWTPIVPAGYTSSLGGSFAVIAATPAAVTVPYASPGNAVLTFSETGLPPGLTWKVTVNGTAMSLTTDGATDSLSFTEPLGFSYSYSITGIAGWQQATLPYSGTVAVTTAPTTEPTLAYGQGLYPVTFSESGLPSGLLWKVTFNSVGNSLTTNGGTDTLTFAPVPNGSYSYAIGAIAGFAQATIPYAGTETVNGAALAVTVSYTPVTYGVTFSESGLPSGLTWKVTFNGNPMSLTTNGGSDTLAFASVPNGTYGYAISGIAGYAQSTVPYSGSEVVNGAPLSVSVRYVPVTYSVTFTESGLPSGLTWKVTFNSVSMSLTTNGGTDTLSFGSVPNGSYSYSIAGVAGYSQGTIPYKGTETVNGAPLAVKVTYTQVTYCVTFWEVGLPSGVTWKVTVNGVAKSLTANGLVDWLTWSGLPNGTYTYTIADIPGWHQYLTPYSGKIVVNGGPVALLLVYLPVTYSVTFSESGLPSGLTWTVTVNGVTKHLTTNGGTDSLTWTCLTNGTYSYSIAAVSGWHQSTLPPSGSVVVNGTPVSEPTLRYTR